MSIGSYMVLWLIALLLFVVVEIATVQLVCVWFAVGSVPALITAALGGPLWLQLLIFLLVSVIAFAFFRPALMKKLMPKKQATNADRVIGENGIVLEEVNNLAQTGRVSANGLDWTARTLDDDHTIPVGTRVRVLEISGVKLIVEPA